MRRLLAAHAGGDEFRPGRESVLATVAGRRRLPMVELDGSAEVVGPDGPVPFLDLFQGRDELVV
jgi:predicted dithiol-disulfide oxidoreductase (DUF899 family)